MGSTFLSSIYEKITASTFLAVVMVLVGLGFLCFVLLLIAHAVIEDYRLNHQETGERHHIGMADVPKILRTIWRSLHLR